MTDKLCECGEPRPHRHEMGMRIFTPAEVTPTEIERGGHVMIGPAHMDRLLEMIDSTGQHGFTQDELAKIYHGNLGADAVFCLNQILDERCPDQPDLRFIDLPVTGGPEEVRALVDQLGIPRKGPPSRQFRHTSKPGWSTNPSRKRRQFGKRLSEDQSGQDTEAS